MRPGAQLANIRPWLEFVGRWRSSWHPSADASSRPKGKSLQIRSPVCLDYQVFAFQSSGGSSFGLPKPCPSLAAVDALVDPTARAGKQRLTTAVMDMDKDGKNVGIVQHAVVNGCQLAPRRRFSTLNAEFSRTECLNPAGRIRVIPPALDRCHQMAKSRGKRRQGEGTPLPIDYRGQPRLLTPSAAASFASLADGGGIPPVGTNQTSTRPYFASSLCTA
jgi:hypothetical protein